MTTAGQQRKTAARDAALRVARSAREAAAEAHAPSDLAPPAAWGGPVVSEASAPAGASAPRTRRSRQAEPAQPGQTCASCPAPRTNARSRYCEECRKKRRVKPKKYPFSEEQDAVLRAAWAEHVSRKAVLVASRRTGYPEHIVRRRATILALSKPRKKEPPWTATELEIVERHAARGHEYVKKALAEAGYQRTLTAIVVKRKRTGCTGRGHGFYTLNEVGKLLGVDAKTVVRWRRAGLISSRARGTCRTASQGGDEQLVSQETLRDFVLQNVHLCDLRKIPPEHHLWFVDLVSGGRAGLAPDEACRTEGKTGGVMNGHVLPD